ncbi:type III restriction protein res subunit [Anopheles sinensis]|uniref:Type III restriction protein res subunit n=1 Tax=Anopheles sinensis TaxID=74873 RepID=A0A084VSL7_ANOSI|nr:type III restriction protein res subunit [Anopheles sinensis]
MSKHLLDSDAFYALLLLPPVERWARCPPGKKQPAGGEEVEKHSNSTNFYTVPYRKKGFAALRLRTGSSMRNYHRKRAVVSFSGAD